jgi:DHA1 family bicyclomycin/chloramphenicol resistance-like MFS transporter
VPSGTRARHGAAPFPLLVAITACGTLGMHLIIPALPATARALAVSAGTIQLTITLYLVGLAIGQLAYGPVSDRFGRRPVLLAGLSLFTCAGAATALAPSASLLIVARIMQSLGGCAGLVLGRAMVRDAAEGDRAAAQLALLTLVMAMAPAGAPVLGGYTVAWFGWRAAFGLLALIGATTTLLAAWRLPETGRRSATGGAGAMVRASLRLLRSRAFRGYAVGGACTTTSFYAFMSASPFIFTNLLHQTPQRIGLYYMGLMVGLAAGGFSANRLAGRVAAARVLLGANLVSMAAACLFLLAWATGTLSVATVVGSIALFMMGAGIASPFALTAAISVNPNAIGAASGLYGCVQMSYGALCTVIVASLNPGSVLTVGAVLLGSTLVGRVALMTAIRTRG